MEVAIGCGCVDRALCVRFLIRIRFEMREERNPGLCKT